MPREIILREALEEGKFHTHALESLLKGYAFSSYSFGIRSTDERIKQSFKEQLQQYFASSPFWKTKKFVLDAPDVHVLVDLGSNAFAITIFPVIVKGNYCKLVRGIAQTRHFCYQCKGVGKVRGKVCDVCNGEKILTKESVQELIAPFFLQSFSAQEMLFHGAGREDVDVRMLGSGRPFALTIENPSERKVDLSQLQQRINHALKGKIELHQLAFAHPQDVARITQSYHTKRYRALVSSPEKISASKLDSFLGKKIDVIQTTPTRVEKRRTMKERPHWVVLEKVVPKNTHEIEIFLHTSAGCYIKEFISGDAGSSNPSIAEWLGVACVCKELDVVEILDNEQ
jgi:tRNA pseudouridine synthase 10